MTYKGIAISGKMRSGKDSAASALIKTDPRFTRYAFADELKRLAGATTGLDYFDEAVKIKYRPFLIALGTAYRVYDVNYWVDKAVQSIRSGTVPVFTDVRYKTEADRLKAAGYFLVRLEPTPQVLLARGAKLLDDPSETDLDNYSGFDLVIPDDGNLSIAATAALIVNKFSPVSQTITL